jgi:hypothetical protein
MLTDPKLKSQVDALWDKLWTGGLSNPLDAIEQFSYLLFMKRLDEEEDRRAKRAKMLGETSWIGTALELLDATQGRRRAQARQRESLSRAQRPRR